MNKLLHILLPVLLASSAFARDGKVDATFIQLNRGAADATAADWSAALDRMEKAGIKTLIIQWSAEGSIAYFNGELPGAKEKYPILDTLFAALEGRKMEVVLGLHNDGLYWTQLGARDRVLRDYFLSRVSHHEEIQTALLKSFGNHPQWTGYYIPEELDDLNWRSEDRRAIVHEYLQILTERLMKNDKERTVSISAFFRGRTSPHIVADNLKDIVKDTKLDHLLLQDGIGVGDPPESYLAIYFDELKKNWPKAGPALWGVVETFRQTSQQNEPFTAEPASARRLRRQIETAAPYFPHLVLFTFLDYADPELGDEAGDLYDVLTGK